MHKARFYFPSVFQHLFVPNGYYRRKLRRILSNISEETLGVIADRVAYCIKLTRPFKVTDDASTLAMVKCWKQSACYYDTREIVRYFPANAQFLHDFTDIVHVPDAPTIVKSRPILPNNANSVLLRLNSVRNFQRTADNQRFADKKPMLVWRGQVHRPWRRDLVL